MTRFRHGIYTLPAEESAHLFDTRIAPGLFRHAPRQREPRAVLLNGSIGAGTDLLAARIADTEFDDDPHPDAAVTGPYDDGFEPVPPVVIINPARWAAHHPAYWQLARRPGGDGQAREEIADDLELWLLRALSTATARRAHIIVDHLFDNRRSLHHVLDQLSFTPAGASAYQIEVNHLATHPAWSWANNLQSYQQLYDELGGLLIFAPDRAAHDTSVGQSLVVADWLDHEVRIPHVVVTRWHAIPTQRGGARRAGPGTEYQFVPTPFASKHRPAPSEAWRPFTYAGEHPMLQEYTSTRHVIDYVRNQRWSADDSAAFANMFLDLGQRLRPEHEQALMRAAADAEAVLHPTMRLPAPQFSPTATQPALFEAVIVGHYPLVTLADLAAVTDLTTQAGHVDIYIVDETMPPDPTTPVRPPDELLDFYAEQQRRAAPELNPVPVPVRVQAWRAALDHAELPPHRVTVVVGPRPELNPARFTAQFPAARTRLVQRINPYDRAQRRHLEQLGQALGTRAYGHSLRTPLPDADTVRRAFAEQDPRWSDGLAPGAAEVLLEAGLPALLMDWPTADHDRTLDPLAPLIKARTSVTPEPPTALDGGPAELGQPEPPTAAI
ncbi:hypothetical protein ACWDUL_20145 [Nocardia niigatensis]